MLKDVVEAHPIPGHRVYLKFEDGVEGEVHVADLITFTGVFASLASEGEFAKLKVDPEVGTIVWPNGANLDPDVLYATVTGQPIELGADYPAAG